MRRYVVSGIDDLSQMAAAKAAEEADCERVKGVLSRVRFASEDGTFAVCDLEMDGKPFPITIVGNILATQPGESVEVIGEWHNDPKFGRQFKIHRIQSVLPVTRDGIERYLSGGFIDGIGPVLAERIVETFGEATLDILDEEPQRLGEVEGIGKVRKERILSAWVEQRSIRDVMVFLQSHAISTTFAVKIYKQYGDRAVPIVSENPYKLAEDIFGIGFRKADAIARASGLEPDAMERLEAGVMYALERAHTEGHMYLPMDELKERAVDLLEVPPDGLGAAIENLQYREKIFVEPIVGATSAVFKRAAYRAEVEAARHLERLATSHALLGATASSQITDASLDEVARHMSITLAPAQREAIRAAWEDKVVVITGGPGTGKTTIVRAVVDMGERAGRKDLTRRAHRARGEAPG